MQRFAAVSFVIFMLAHALVPALPAYLCTDGGRSLSPCSPLAEEGADQSRAEWHIGDCCKLTAAATVDTQPPKITSAKQHVLYLLALLLPTPLPTLRDTPLLARISRLTRGDPLFRGPPASLRTILRI